MQDMTRALAWAVFVGWAALRVSIAYANDAAPAGTPAAARSPAQDLQWRLIGPFRAGRTRAVTGIAGRPDTFLVGAVNGGVWKTDDAGRTWKPLFDAEPTQSIGAIAVAPSDPAVIYVGSGEGLERPDLSVGNGIYRSADGGATWTHLALADAQQIPDLAVDPRDANRLYAAVLGHPYGPSSERGIYRSTDGGATWARILSKDADTGGSSVKLDPFDPNTLYASLWQVRSGPWEDDNVYNGTGGGLFKSTDGGDHWQPLTHGLPDNLAQIEIAVAPNRRGRLYATVATSTPGDYGFSTGLGVYRSDDGGESWSRMTTDPRPALRIGGGDLPIIKVDPHDADVLYSASIVTMKSTDGGEHWLSLRGAPGGDDYQNLWISPDDSKRIALVGDQGAIVSVNGGTSWSSWFNQPTAQLYHIGITNTFPYRLCSGQQESGSVCISTRGNDGEINFRDWHPVGVIEYGYVVPDPTDPNTIYGSGRNVVTKTDLPTGQVQDITPIPLKGKDVRTDRTEPLFFAPQDPQTLYYAANRLYETHDEGRSWQTISPDLAREAPGAPPSVGGLMLPNADKQRGVIYAASPSAISPGLIWVGTDDGLVWVTHDDGGHWQNVTPPTLSAWSKVTQIDASHFDPQVAYVSVSRFRVDDLKPYLYATHDGGQTWQLITTGLPDDAPANTIREDTERRGLLFAGTEKGVWTSLDDGGHWISLQRNLPHTSVRDLAVHGQDLIAATHGRAFWVMDDISPLRQFAPTAPNREAALLKPAPALRVRRSTGTDTPIPPDEPYGRNPPDGAVIDYYLEHNAVSTVSLDILDSSGAVIRHVASTDPPSFTPEELERELIPVYWLRLSQPPATRAGMHRWVWDLHYATPRTPQRGFPISAVPGDTPQEPLGPLAAPGDYRVRLSVGAHRWEQPLTVTEDPRLKLSPEELRAEFAASRQLAGVLDASTGALLEAQSLQAQLDERDAALGGAVRQGPLAKRVEALDRQVKALLDPSGAGTALPRALTRLNGDVEILYSQVAGVDAAPTQVQTNDIARAADEWPAVQTAWEAIEHEIPALNAALVKARLPRIRLELAAPRNPEMADEE